MRCEAYPRASWLFKLTCLVLVSNSCLGFSFQEGVSSKSVAFSRRASRTNHDQPPARTSALKLGNQDAAATQKAEIPSIENPENNPWAKHALLISSFTDGIVASPDAGSFLKYCIANVLLSEQVRRAETSVRDSVIASPCNGPNMEAFNSLEFFDKVQEEESDNANNYGETADQILRSLLIEQQTDNGHTDTTTIRLLYIPTAAYALNPNSSNTPGKQRQRARADGKKRRNQVVQHLDELLKSHVPDLKILTITLDLDDASLKQPAGSDEASDFPSEGVESLTTWEPHIVYVEGGNTFWLQHCIEKGDWGQHIQSACTGPDAKSVYIGKSAGAIIAGTTVETATWKGWDDPSVVPSKETYEDWQGHPGLSMVGSQAFFPHMNDNWKSLVEEKRAGISGGVVCLGELDACCVEGSSKQTVILSGEVPPGP